MSQKVTLTTVSRNEKTSKAGKKYISLGIKCAEYGEQFINGFGNKSNQDWKAGDEVTIEVTKKPYNGKEYLNFETPNVTADLLSEVNKLKVAFEQLRVAMTPIYKEWKARQPQEKPKVAGTQIEYPEESNEVNF